MPVRLTAVTFDARDAHGLARFWGGLLGREAVVEPGAALLRGDDAQVGLRFVEASSVKSGANRMHLHVTSTSPEDQQATVEAALTLGGQHLDVGQLPEEDHVVLARNVSAEGRSRAYAGGATVPVAKSSYSAVSRKSSVGS